jgi:molybdopterin synthase sulfur carrier subunit
MDIEVKLFGTLREPVEDSPIRLEVPSPETVDSALRALEAAYPELDGMLLDADGELVRSVTVLRNGRHIEHFAGVETSLEPGDTLSLTPPLAGGCE